MYKSLIKHDQDKTRYIRKYSINAGQYNGLDIFEYLGAHRSPLLSLPRMDLIKEGQDLSEGLEEW